MNDPTSVSLLCRVQEHEAGSWNEFADVYDTLIRRWLGGRGVKSQDVDDVVQEVMTFVHLEIPKFDHNGRTGAFRNWLRQVTSNRLREFWRKQERNRRSGPDLGEMAEQLADDQSELSRLWQREHDGYVLNRLIDEISSKFQQSSIAAFRAVVLDEIPAQQVAADLGMSIGAVRVAQSRVLRALRELGEGLID